PYILKNFFVDGDLLTAANKGMDASGWLSGNNDSYNFALRRAMGIVFPFPMVCPLKIDHGVQKGANALGYDMKGCNTCHSTGSTFWKYLGYTSQELQLLQKPRE
ncbi:MAG: hypothetical protein WCQ99_14135, partial [Pseudomonadota bacterium]